MNPASDPRKTLKRKLLRKMYDRGWIAAGSDDSLKCRIYRALDRQEHWYDWGHPVMQLTGRDWGGNSDWPRARDLYWIPREYAETPAAFDYLSQHPDVELRGDCFVTTEYSVVNETRQWWLSWNVFDLQDSGQTLVIGRYPSQPEDGGRIQLIPGGLNRAQVRMFMRWYLVDHKLKAQWLGLRSWLWGKALHAAVDNRRPFRCNASPERGSGGYSHWACHLKKRHAGEHRFANVAWEDGGKVRHVEPAR